MKKTFTHQDMEEAWNQGVASGRNNFVLDERNDQSVIDGLRKQFKRLNLKFQSFDEWMDAMFNH